MDLEGCLVHGGWGAMGRRVPASLNPSEATAGAIASSAHPLMAETRNFLINSQIF